MCGKTKKKWASNPPIRLKPSDSTRCIEVNHLEDKGIVVNGRVLLPLIVLLALLVELGCLSLSPSLRGLKNRGNGRQAF